MPDIPLPLLISAALPVFLLMGTGALLRRLRVLTPEGDHALVGLAVNVTYPCFIIGHIVGNESLRTAVNVWLPMLCGAVFMIAGGALAWLAAPVFGMKNGPVRRTFALACSIQNYGYLPIPIMRVLFPDGAWTGALFVFSLGIELVLWTLGVWLMNPHAKGVMRRLLNPVVLSIVAGLWLNQFNWREWTAAPGGWALLSVRHAVHLLGECAVPVGLIVVGATLFDLLSQPGWHSDAGAAAGGLVMRLGILPLTMLGMLALLPAGQEFRHVVAVQAAMPAAVFPMIIARRYGGDEATAMRVIVITTLVSLFTIPFAVQWALRLAG
jgi:hypothetical protein